MSLQSDISSTRRFYSHYPEEKLKFSWIVTNFSKIFNRVDYRFFTQSKATTWELRLTTGSIALWRYFEGQTVKVVLECNIMTTSGNISSRFNETFGRAFDNYRIISLPRDLAAKLKDDVLELQCTMIITGHAINHESTGLHLESHNSKKLRLDFAKLFYRKEHCDIKIRIGADEIQVHRAVLCARSPVFDRMFLYNMLENENNVIEISDIDVDTLQKFVSYLYSAEVKDICWNVAVKLYYVADKYEVQDLRTICAQFLELHLTVDQACDVLMLADMHKDDELKTSVKKFIRMYISSVKQTESWNKMTKVNPKLSLEVFNDAEL